MIKNFILSSLRTLKRQKVYSAVNIIGLSTGIAVSLMLFLFIQHELGFDGFHENSDRMFRVVSRYTTNNGNTSQSAITFGSVVPEMKKDIPEISNATRIMNAGNTDLVFNQTTYQSRPILYSDVDFFNVFSFNSLYGTELEKVAFDNHGVVLSEQLAQTIFGDKVPLGQFVKIDGEEYTILDVVSVPKKSHIRFDLLISLEVVPDLYDWAYHSGLDFHSYGVYAENSNPEAVNEKIVSLYNKQMDERFSNFISASDNYVQPFKDVYLRSENIQSNMRAGSLQTIYVLGGINLLILLVAVINYINLTTAQYEKRVKEIGVRKVVGAGRKQLVIQFLSESVLLTLMAFVLALGLTQLSFDRFGSLMQIEADISYWSQPMILLLLLGVVVVLGLLSGLYPALFISSFRPSRILKRDFPGLKRGSKGGKVLVALQFVVAIVLVTNLAFLNRQINFVKNKELGFNKDQMLVINNVSDKQQEAFESIAAALSNSPNVLEVTAAQSALGTGTSGQTVYLQGEDPKTAQPIGEIRTLHNFINTHDIQVVKGRDFSKELVTDKNAFLINQSGEKRLFPNGEDPIGKTIVVAGRKGPIIGVVEDFHYTNLKRRIAPLVLSLDNPYRLAITIKLNTSNLQSSLDHISSVLQTADPDYELSYYFMDDYFNNMFQAEERNASLINYSSLVAALISLVGLMALISHRLAKRVKEVAIRKVLGAEFKQLLWVLTREFYWVIIMANIVAIPLSVLVINNWIQAFAYRLEIVSQWPVFLMVAVLSLLLALGLILNLAIKRVRANPAEILANE